MTISDRSLLERNKLFQGISMESVESMLKDCQVITVNGHATFLEVGQKINSLYLVLDGELRVYLGGQVTSEHSVLGPGECVGGLALISAEHTAAALVIAAKDTRMMVLPHELVWSLVGRIDAIARNLLTILAGRTRNDDLLQVTTPVPSLEFEVATNIDKLTGLHNKNRMDEAFQRMEKHSKVPLFLLLADIDRFKSINDRHGYLAGDSVLKGVARILAINLRPEDLLVYMGGDRYAVLLPEKSPDMAVKLAERLREAIAAPALRIRSSGASRANDASHATLEEHVTMSFGIVAVQSGDTLDKVLAAAERALAQAKTEGRNRVNLATAPA